MQKFLGLQLGVAFINFVASNICHNLTWEYIFYITGGMTALSLILWFLLISDTPIDHKFISEKERDYILEYCWETSKPGKTQVSYTIIKRFSAR